MLLFKTFGIFIFLFVIVQSQDEEAFEGADGVTDEIIIQDQDNNNNNEDSNLDLTGVEDTPAVAAATTTELPPIVDVAPQQPDPQPQPTAEEGEGGEGGTESVQEANPSQCTDACHPNAACASLASGKTCCRCNEGFVGNGVNCYRANEVVVIRGKLTGRINDIPLEDVELVGNVHTMPNDAKSQVAILKNELNEAQLLINVVTPFFWLFGVDPDPDLNRKPLNGFSLTGGLFNRVSWVKYYNNEREEIGSVNIRQSFHPDPNGLETYKVDTEINGQLPVLNQNDFIVYQDFKQEYIHRPSEDLSRQQVESSGSIKYKKLTLGYSSSQQAFEIVYNDRIDYSACTAAHDLDGNTNVVVTLKELTSTFYSKTIQFVENHSLLPKNVSSDACDRNDCNELATCYVEDGNPGNYYCVCKIGFNGDGYECLDANECEAQSHVCSNYASCVNTPGFYDCKCNPPYVGDGRRCELERADEGEDVCSNCHTNAECVRDGDSLRCSCLPGYYGNGYICQLDYVPEPAAESPSYENSCTNCDINAQCVQDNKPGSCCVCNEGYVGNGKYCFYAGSPIVLTGKVNGLVNGVEINDVEFFSSVLTLSDENRNHAGVRNVPIKLASSFQVLRSLVSSIDWLFAGPHKSAIVTSNEHQRTVVNGFTMTGGNFTRTARLRFQDETDILKELVIEQEFGGLEIQDGTYYRINVKTKVNGELPLIDMGSSIYFRDYDQEYTRTRRGLIESRGTIGYEVVRVEDSEFTFSYQVYFTETINFNQCAYERDYADTWKVNSRDMYILHIKGDDLVRYTSANYIYGHDVSGDPCMLNACSIYANCIQDDYAAERYRCACKPGFAGDGFDCRDVNECDGDESACDKNAVCYNLLGHYECKCKAPYQGSGNECLLEQSCSMCSTNAFCETTENGGTKCICSSGYTGNGFQCEPIRSPEDVCSNCSPYAECLVNKYSRRYECRCKDGFLGNGVSCNPLPCNEYYNCGQHSTCEARVDGKYECVCNQGYHGDGFRCTTQSCDITNNCGENARCLLDSLTQTYHCACAQGYAGNGYACVFDSQPCNVAKNCHHNAECLYDEHLAQHKCSCKPGYIGDGQRCTAQNSCGRDNSVCDINALCIYESRVGDHICRCKSGYEGDGLHRRCYPLGEGPVGLGLVYAQGASLHKISLDRSQQDNVQPYRSRIVYIPHQTAVAVDYDCHEQNVYWSDVSGKIINKVRADGSKYSVVLQDLESPEGLAIDWISRNIYITDSKAKTIEIANLKGTYRKVLIKTNLHNPRGIAVDPVDGYIYWTDWNRKSPKIERANMDGTHRTVIVKDNLGIPNGLYYDHRRREVCWGDAKTKRIECIGRDGNGRRNVTTVNQMHVFDLAEVGQNIYWSDWTRKEIPSVSKSGHLGEPLKLAPGGNGRIYGVSVVKHNCPAATNACAFDNGGCEYLCVPLTNGHRQCICPDNVAKSECAKSHNAKRLKH